jgi:lipopolysaccharide export system ATP-binding protein
MQESCQLGFPARKAVIKARLMSALDQAEIDQQALAQTMADAPANASPPIPQGGLQVISIAKSYDKRAVLNDISLSVGKGEVLGLLGPNGAG